MCPGVHRRGFLQSLDVLVHHPCGDILHLHIPDDGVDVVGNQRVLAVVHGHAPPLFAVEGNKVGQGLRNILIGRRQEGVGAFLALNLRLALQCFLVRGTGFPLLLGLAVLVRIGINNRIVFLSFDDGCHNEPSFLMSQIKRLQPLVKRPLGNSYGVANSYAFEKVLLHKAVCLRSTDA